MTRCRPPPPVIGLAGVVRALGVLAALTLLAAGCAGDAGRLSPDSSGQPTRPAALPCERLVGLRAEATTLIGATLVSAPTRIADVEVTTPMCRVQGSARPSADSDIRFEVWLPVTAKDWTGRLKVNGTGGFAGAVPFARLAQDLGDGFVTAGSNMGHDGGESPSWTLNHPDKVRDWGLRAHYYVTTAARALAAAYYGQPVRHAYFEGCSNGGRQAMMMAQRYPELFDGIASGAPSLFYPDLLMWLLWSGRALTPVEGQPPLLPPASRQLLARAALAACDKDDGLADDQITNPPTCRFDPAVLSCQGDPGPDCLTAQQIEAARALYGGSHASAVGQGTRSSGSTGGDTRGSTSGKPRYPGVLPGSESVWDPAFADRGGYGPFVGHAVYGKTSPPFDWRRDLAGAEAYDAVRSALTPITAAPSPDLSAFTARGGKLIQYHGWSDPVVTPQGSTAYLHALIQFQKLKDLPPARIDAAVAALTADQARADLLERADTVRDWHRLFMLPQVGHCRGGDGPGEIGGGFPEPPSSLRGPDTHVVSALVRWVEHGKAPETMIATRLDQGRIVRQRPICAYPQRAAYRGSGDINAAESFSCVRPSTADLPIGEAELGLVRRSLEQRAVVRPVR